MAAETIYLRNLDENIKLDRLKELLRREFSKFGTVLDVVAHRNIRLRGQAFIAFDEVEQATQALESKNGQDFHGKPLVIEYAKTPADVIVKKQGQAAYEQHKKQRLEAKQEHKKPKTSKRGGSKEGQSQAKRSRKQQVAAAATGSGSATPTASGDNADATGASSRLPRNKVIFLENLPPSITQDTLTQIFSSFPGFFEVRLVKVRRVAFVEYESEDQAAIAREATMGLVNDGHTIKITYAKK